MFIVISDAYLILVPYKPGEGKKKKRRVSLLLLFDKGYNTVKIIFWNCLYVM